MKRSLAALVPLLALATVQRPATPVWAVGSISAAPFPYISGSIIPLGVDGLRGPFSYRTTGGAHIGASGVRIEGAPGDRGSIVAAAPGGVAERAFTIGAPPDAGIPFIAVASYDDGIVVHDAQPPFAARSVLAIGGPPADVAIDARGTIATADTDGTRAMLASLAPWNVRSVDGVPFADEVAFDDRLGDLFVTDRDVDGAGAITRISPDGTTTRRVLGLTSEGLAVDEQHGLIYVANVNDGTISVVDAATLVERRRFAAVPRVFSLALSRDGTMLYAVSNQSVDSPFAQAGSVTLFRLRNGEARRIVRSGPLNFPLGAALDEARGRLYVTDESADIVYVLDARTLREAHAPLRTCDVPWKPTVDAERLYVPCARSDRVDVFDTRTLARVSGAPFVTGGYPLAVAVWKPQGPR